MARCEQRRPKISAAVLLVGAISHALLCGPAIACRGYPPIDPIWYGATFIWPIPILISAYFDSVRFKARRNQLMIYALVTAFFSAGTVVHSVPRHVDLGGMLLGTIFFGPLHLLIAFALDFVAQRLYSPGRRLVDQGRKSSGASFTLFGLMASFVWIGLIFGIPMGYKSFVTSSVNRSAIRRANEDWQTNALIYRDEHFVEIGNCTIQYEFDPETGLQLKHQRPDLGFADRYNTRIGELIKVQGIPSYSIKSIMPNPDELIGYMSSTEMNFVETFPIDLTENIHLMRRGSLAKWGIISTNNSDSLSIVTPHSVMGVGSGVMPVHTKIARDIIYIRNGPNWVGAFLLDGRMIMSASRDP